MRPLIIKKALRAAAHFALGLTMEKSLSRSSVKELFWEKEKKNHEEGTAGESSHVRPPNGAKRKMSFVGGLQFLIFFAELSSG